MVAGLIEFNHDIFLFAEVDELELFFVRKISCPVLAKLTALLEKRLAV